MSNNRLQYRASELILKHLRGELNMIEQKDLESWRSEAPEHQALFEELINEGSLGEDVKMIDGVNQRIREKIYAAIPEASENVVQFPQNLHQDERGLESPIRKMFIWKRIAVAASILLAVGLGGYFMFFNKKDKPAEIVTTVPDDVKAPETNRAMITLADGRKVYLDSANNGRLALQGNVNVVKAADGKIVYSEVAATSSGNDVVFNTLSNPRGSKVIDMTLSDGSRVWLNAGSSVTYPVVFTSNERKVSITGEAYFEVAHNSAMPFKVSKGEMEITVLGTQFNVNGYDDENDIKVTLLEGSVRVLRSVQGDKPVVLKPGQQARVASSISVMEGIDTEEVMAWKNGKFQFRSIDIKTLMRQIARWYDVEVVYTEEVTKRFNGKIPMTMSAANVFKVLEETGGVHFKIEEKKVTVMK